METCEAIRSRSSIRAFLPQPVSREAIARVLEVSRWAPSGRNRQPWRVTVVTGAARDALVVRLLERARARHAEIGAMQGEPPEVRAHWTRLRELFDRAAEALGQSLWEFLMAGSYGFYGAPVVIVVASVSSGHAGAEVAPFITTLLLAAHDQGLGACWLGMPLAYPDIIREELGIPEEHKLAGALALGYADLASPANGFRSERAEVESFTRWVGFEG
jgi:nitroreductase